MYANHGKNLLFQVKSEQVQHSKYKTAQVQYSKSKQGKFVIHIKLFI
jgi:hypothetical protein